MPPLNLNVPRGWSKVRCHGKCILNNQQSPSGTNWITAKKKTVYQNIRTAHLWRPSQQLNVKKKQLLLLHDMLENTLTVQIFHERKLTNLQLFTVYWHETFHHPANSYWKIKRTTAKSMLEGCKMSAASNLRYICLRQMAQWSHILEQLLWEQPLHLFVEWVNRIFSTSLVFIWKVSCELTQSCCFKY